MFWLKQILAHRNSKQILKSKCSKVFFHEKTNVFLQCRRQIFTCLSFFAEKVILELNCTKHFFGASKNTNSVFSATKQIMRMRGHKCSKASFSVRKSSKCNFKSKATTWKMILLMKWMFFAMQKTDFHVFELFCRKSHFRA